MRTQPCEATGQGKFKPEPSSCARCQFVPSTPRPLHLLRPSPTPSHPVHFLVQSGLVLSYPSFTWYQLHPLSKSQVPNPSPSLSHPIHSNPNPDLSHPATSNHQHRHRLLRNFSAARGHCASTCRCAHSTSQLPQTRRPKVPGFCGASFSCICFLSFPVKTKVHVAGPRAIPQFLSLSEHTITSHPRTERAPHWLDRFGSNNSC